MMRLGKAMRTSQTQQRFSIPRYDPRRSLIQNMSDNLTTTFTEFQAVSKNRDSVVWYMKQTGDILPKMAI
jgi:hypothetical protein